MSYLEVLVVVPVGTAPRIYIPAQLEPRDTGSLVLPADGVDHAFANHKIEFDEFHQRLV